jgi:hypothetical protein
MTSTALRFAAAAGATLLVPAGSLSAVEEEGPHAQIVEFINETPHTVVFIYAHMDNVTDLEDDLLGDAVLEPGQRFKIDLDLGPRRCIYEISVYLKTEQRLHYRPFDACKESALHLTMDALDPR